MDDKKVAQKCSDELEKINKEFNEVIAKKGHCYDRGEEEGGDTCDCVTYYKKYLDTKNSYRNLIKK